MADKTTSKISAGLDAREREGTANAIPLEKLNGAPSDLRSLRQMAARATSKLKRTIALTEAVNADVARFTESKRPELAAMGKSRLENGSIVDRIGEPARQALLDEAVNERRRMALGTSEDERIKIRRELKAALDTANLVRDLHTDPIRVIHDRTISSTKRATMAANLQASGPMAVADAMRSAVIRKDFELASAALSAYDKLTKEQREHVPIGRIEFADAIAGLETRKAKAAYLALEIAHTETEIVNTEAAGRGVGEAKIGLAMKRKELEALAAELPEETSEGLPGLTQGTAGPESVNAPDPAKSSEELLARFRAQGQEILDAAMRGEFDRDEDDGTGGSDE